MSAEETTAPLGRSVYDGDDEVATTCGLEETPLEEPAAALLCVLDDDEEALKSEALGPCPFEEMPVEEPQAVVFRCHEDTRELVRKTRGSRGRKLQDSLEAQRLRICPIEDVPIRQSEQIQHQQSSGAPIQPGAFRIYPDDSASHSTRLEESNHSTGLLNVPHLGSWTVWHTRGVLFVQVSSDTQSFVSSKPRHKLWNLFAILVVLGCGIGAGRLFMHLFHSESHTDEPITSITIQPKEPRVGFFDNCMSEYNGNLSWARRSCQCREQRAQKLDETDWFMNDGNNRSLRSISNGEFRYDHGGMFSSCSWLYEDAAVHEEANDALQDHELIRYALASLLEAWTGNEPYRWKNREGWASSVSECNWFGIFCDAEWQVVELRLPNNNLLASGGLPTEILLLTALKVLDLSSNELEIPSIPAGIGRLSNLEMLNLASNAIQGSLPFELFPKSLVSLYLNSTWLYNSIPTTISHLTQLEVLDVSRSKLSGSLPTSLGLLRNLRELILADNELTGALPFEITAMTKLENLNLDDNRLMQTRLLSEIGNLAKLEKLHLNRIKTIGSLPTELGTLANLKELRLLGPEVSEEASPNSDLVVSGFGGSIPTELGLLSRLEVLDLAHNSLMGELPTELGQLTALDACDLSFNDFSGTLPEEVSTLTNLQILRLRGRTIAHVTDSDGALSDIVSKNNSYPASGGVITGTFPAGLANLEDSLLCLDTTGTLLTGPVPESLCGDTFRFITVHCIDDAPPPCSCCVCNGPDYCDMLKD